MAVFNPDDRKTIKSLTLTMVGFTCLMVFLIGLAMFLGQ